VCEGISARVWKCSFFRDAEAIEAVDLGEVWFEEKKSVIIHVRNDEAGMVRDIVYQPIPDVEIVGPLSMEFNEVAPLTITWKAGETIEKGLSEDLIIHVTLVL